MNKKLEQLEFVKKFDQLDDIFENPTNDFYEDIIEPKQDNTNDSVIKISDYQANRLLSDIKKYCNRGFYYVFMLFLTFFIFVLCALTGNIPFYSIVFLMMSIVFIYALIQLFMLFRNFRKDHQHYRDINIQYSHLKQQQLSQHLKQINTRQNQLSFILALVTIGGLIILSVANDYNDWTVEQMVFRFDLLVLLFGFFLSLVVAHGDYRKFIKRILYSHKLFL